MVQLEKMNTVTATKKNEKGLIILGLLKTIN
jgi:hypothetical protein